ncbi:MAG TPA: Holliday junction branch migration protein RuvA [Microbacterium sp.]|uniref:Holliday junction branch migration protein RuvA n=1 Tax=Microbacterium sp. TaxID=51671 RepID=UPI002B5757FD|nr:Holliday junction branch migration protein RuvA [Microbacterium sp.]HWI32064.1 Holliday junction branch migration protein RuvA [Microbacterium sp.]
MISSLRGTAAHVDADTLVVEVGGVGLAVAVTAGLARSTRVGDAVRVHTHLVVREDALSLFGFETREELTAFGLLLGVTGVGPKSALGVLSGLSVEQIAEAVAADDDAPFRRVSGIGPKTAKLIVVQLAGKLEAPVRTAARSVHAPAAVLTQVAEALTGLGWPERVATEAVTTAAAEASAADRASVPSLLRLTLASLGPAPQGAARG